MFQGERLILRAACEADLPRMHAFSQDAELAGLDSGHPRPRSMEGTRAMFESWQKENPAQVFFAIEADGQYIGDCALMGLDNPHGTAELGIVIGDRDYWNRGYGREAIRLLLHYGFHYLGLRRIALTTHVKNPRAIRCYLACGFVEEGRPRKAIWVEGEYVDLVNMSILKEEWEAQQKGG